MISLPKNSITALMKQASSDSFYRNALIFTAASLFTSVLNYIFYPILARMLSVEEFGELQLITSIILQLSTAFSGLNLINISLMTNSEKSEGERLVAALQRVIVWLFIGIALLLVAASPWLGKFFHFSSYAAFALAAPSLVISALSVFWTSILQSKQDFTSLSIYSVATGLFKLLSSAGLVYIGFGVIGGVIGLSVGLVFSLVLVRLVTRHHLPPLAHTVRPPRSADRLVIRKYAPYIVSVIVSLTVSSILLSLDTLVVKRSFESLVAGEYAGVATIARIIFFASSPLVAIMIPLLKIKNTRSNLSALGKTLALSLSISIVGAMVLLGLSEQVINILLGYSYLPGGAYLPAAVLLAALSTILNLNLNYLLAVRNKYVLPVMVALLALGVALANLEANSPSDVAIGLSAAVGSGIILTLVIITLDARKQRTLSYN